ncbi:Tn3-like element ISXc4 family transposase [Xanthomonas euvesicatoria pv. euvesicatoria]|uniref:Tn3-like element ISXc4 family transposase n=1 Tax=Xanthomonas euvesicatoria pv. euvesicatoria TaxID=2753541 RepID=A0ABS8LS23_XANEU|nr:Tn3-like element ISXc4 family transposase [Xanthomonas euvesicatoria]KLB37982.1 transposase [Xanthomonas euvesicatoria]MCC8637178.1 Tn3-like element ISXc4 family transposase [Xanthomonas euvesicatoria pv. euvesicatoria]MCC8641441.1 Tn3-like element ISXc4 family transposase [Xanthomonas euvesicatoria pv. euvesicatoria]
MPVSFLSTTQRERYGRYPDTLSSEELARYFHLDDDDREWIATKRRDSSRLGYALQLTTARFLGTFLEDPTAVPSPVLHTLSSQLGIADPSDCVIDYRTTRQRWQHTSEIRTRYGYREFTGTGVQFRLGRWLCALCWTGTDRPSALFDYANGWLVGHKVLLPGVTLLERFIAEIRSRMESRLWRLLVHGVTPEQRQRLDDLLKLVEGSRQSWLDRLRKGPVRVSAPALVAALLRIETVRGLGIKLPGTHVPPSRIAALARFASTAKVSAVARLPEVRRIATLVAFVHCLEASAQDDAIDVLDLLLRELFTKAEKEDRKVRQRSLKDLDRAASTLAEACRMLLDPALPDGELRERVYAAIGHDELAQALNEVRGLVRPPNDVFYTELEARKATVSRFLPALLRVIRFDANPAAQPLAQALQWLHEKPDHDPPTAIVGKAWQRHVVQDDGRINATAYSFCALDKLRSAIRRRDVFISPSWRYANPRAGLLAGAEWEASRPIVCRSLSLSAQPEATLSELTRELDETYRRVAARLPQNDAVRFENVGDKTELVLSPLEALEEPPSLIALRNEIKARMPRVDLPEILLEVAGRTGCMEAFTHLTERTARAADLTTSLCAVLMAEACNTGPEPLVRPDTPALKRDRLMWVDQNYVRDDTLTACNAVLVAAQSRIALARTWGGGDVASADGMRFVVPVRTIHAGPNPKYFNRGRGVTWYNLLSDQRTGLNAITVPGTLRDSLILLAVVLEQQTELQPTQIMTDTGAYSDLVFGLFRLSNYRFCPRLADVGGTRFWRVDPDADYGDLNALARQRVNLDRITPHWDDVLRLVGSLKLGLVPAMGIMRTLQVDERPTSLAQAIAEIGRIDKTIHTLNFIDDEARRRATLLQLNLGEGRHSLAREVFHGKRGELFQRYREGQEDQLSALGLVVNMIVLWNTLYMDAVLTQLRSEGYPVKPEDEARLSPFGHEHINMLGRYSFSVPEAVARGELRPLTKPNDP